MRAFSLVPGKVRPLDRHYVRLTDHALAHVEHLARLAGVSPSDVINYVVSEVFESGLPGDGREEATVRPPRPAPLGGLPGSRPR
jgi:hypothetical protein